VPRRPSPGEARYSPSLRALRPPDHAEQILSLIDWDLPGELRGFAGSERPRWRSGERKREKEAVGKASDGNALPTRRRQSQPQELEGRHPRSDRVRGYTLTLTLTLTLPLIPTLAAAAAVQSVSVPVTLPDPAQQLSPHRL
jgi:hypothetical protein